MADTDYADHLELLINTRTQAESPLHSLNQSSGGVGLNVNTNNTEFICFKHVKW